MRNVAHGPLVYCLLGLLSLWQLWFVNTKTTFLLFCLIQATDSFFSCSVCYRILTASLLFYLLQNTESLPLVLFVTGCWQAFSCSVCFRLLTNLFLFWLSQAADSLSFVLIVTGYFQILSCSVCHRLLTAFPLFGLLQATDNFLFYLLQATESWEQL